MVRAVSLPFAGSAHLGIVAREHDAVVINGHFGAFCGCEAAAGRRGKETLGRRVQQGDEALFFGPWPDRPTNANTSHREATTRLDRT